MEKQLKVADTIEEKVGTLRAHCFIGFDGVSDELIDVVATRPSAGQYEAMESMATLGQRLLDSAGKSCNIELIPKRRKLGGNGPILANALLEGGHEIFFVGTIGEGEEIEPLFQPMAKRCSRVISLGPSAYTQALEFHDGKVMLGKIQAFDRVTLEALLEQIPPEELIAIHEDLDLFVSANWTMLLATNEIWRGIVADVVPHLTKRSEERPRWMFIDLADPAKRTDQDIDEALNLLQGLSKRYSVILGLNASEEKRIATVLGYHTEKEGAEGAEELAIRVREALGIAQVVFHTSRYTIAATEEGSVSVQVPYCPNPKINTGAGDNFNAGYCNALLYGMNAEEALISGIASSGFYIRKGWSPTMEELSHFLRLWSQNAHDRIMA